MPSRCEESCELMSDVYMFADETGNLDYNVFGGGSRYFGIGTATWKGDHGEHLWQAAQLRFKHAREGVELPAGYHAKDDRHVTRTEVYQLIAAQAPRFDATFLAKSKAFPNVRARGENYLYQMAWFLHFKEIAKRVTGGGDTLYVAVATLGTKARKKAFQQAIEEVCQYHAPRWCNVVVAHWDSATSWGLQVADYGLWAVQRRLERGDDKYMWAVQPTLGSEFLPWGKA
jgi:hypothetical protein